MGFVARTEEEPGVERLRGSVTLGGRPLYWTSCFRVAHRDGDVLIDALSPRLATLVSERLPVPATVLLTHGHEDHVGAAPALARRGSRVFAPESELRTLALARRVPAYRHVVWGSPAIARAEPVPDRLRTSAGTFRSVDCPGHSVGHRAYLHEETGALFTGDAYFPRRRYARFDENVPAIASSLRSLAALGADRAYPAHGPTLERPREALERAADALDAMARRARALHAAGRSIREIRRDLVGPEGALFFLSQGEFAGRHLARSLLEDEP